LIAETRINAVFNERVISDLADNLKLSRNTNVIQFGENVRESVRAYFVERARTNWKAIEREIKELYRSAARAELHKPAAERLAFLVEKLTPATRQWLDRCAVIPIVWPSIEEIKSNTQADSRVLKALSYGLERVEGRKRPGGKRSISIKPLLRVPQNRLPRKKRARSRNRQSQRKGSIGDFEKPPRQPKLIRGRPRDLAARELIQGLALDYLTATERRPPRRVNDASRGPFLRFVKRVFELVGIPSGNVAQLINEREIIRKKMARRRRMPLNYQ
jgi:hypothetical protein